MDCTNAIYVLWYLRSNDMLSQSCLRKLHVAVLPAPQLLDKRQDMITLVIQALYKPYGMGGIESHKAPKKVMKCGCCPRKRGG